MVNLVVKANTTEFYIHKVGEYNEARTVRKDLPGAAFALHDVNPNGSIGSRIDNSIEPVNANETMPGTAFMFKVSKLEIGKKYYLVETKAPSGYNLIPEPISVTVTENGDIDITVNKDNAIYLKVKTYPGKTSLGQNAKQLEIYNSPVALLPFSGGSGILIWTGLGIAGLFISINIMRRIEQKLI